MAIREMLRRRATEYRRSATKWIRLLIMAALFSTIRRLVEEGRYIVGDHASERLEERGIMEWQVVAEIATGKVVAERPRARPNPAVEIRESLPDGTDFMAVWSYLRQSGVAKLVTVHFFD